MASADSQPSGHGPDSKEFALERYRYILQQIHTVNENVHRYLAIYQTLSTTLVGGGLVLFVSFRRWEISVEVAHRGLIGVLILETAVAAFSCLMVGISVANWVDLRKEECEITDEFAHVGFRKPPRVGNMYRWYETYIVVFIVVLTALVWIFFWFGILGNLK